MLPMIRDMRIGVLMGGQSAEREVSLRSGSAIAAALRGLGHDVVDIDVGPDVCQVLTRERISLCFIALHGGYGENGAIQGLLEVLGIPYTGSGVLASALAMDKEASKKLFLHHGVPVAPFTIVDRKGSGSCQPTVPFAPPWVVKPVTEGSSVGVAIVKERNDLAEALFEAFRYCDRVMLEQYVKGKEIQVGILNNGVLGSVEVRPKTEFYSYEAKYTAGMTEYILPPELPRERLDMLEAYGLAAHRALGCSGATRVDLIDGADGCVVLEVNTIPGMTETSLLPKIAGTAGYPFPALVQEILKDALAVRSAG